MRRTHRSIICFAITVVLVASFFSSPSNVFADSECACPVGQDVAACNTTQIACWQDKIAQKQQAANTLSNTVSTLNGQIVVQQLQINQTKLQIAQIEKQVQDLSERISGLNISLDSLTNVLLQRVSQNYKRRSTNPLAILLVSNSLSSFFTRYKYLQVAQEHTTQMMHDAETQRVDFNQEKTLKQQKEDEINQKKQQLLAEEADLTKKRTDVQNLLQQTRNDEARYQQLLAQAQAELSSFQSFTTSIGIGVLPPQNSPDGWYFSQRDQRWANACIGNSCGTRNSSTILDVGCLISSTAMVMKKFGQDVTPLSIARNSSYFFSTTAYMVQPWPTPSGYTYVHTRFSEDRVDSELSSGRPVIVHLRINGRDGHFIVLKSGSKDNYTMHDPAEGYDKNFSDFYRISQIDSLAYLQKT